MNRFDKINSVYYDEKLLFYDVFWIKSKNKVYIQAPLFLVGWYGNKLKNEYPINIKEYTRYLDLYPGESLIDDLSLVYNGVKISFKTHILGRACFMFVADITEDVSVLSIDLNYQIKGVVNTLKLELYPNDRPKANMAIGNMLLDNNDVMDDWLHYNSLAGVDHFFHYDNGTKDKTTLNTITSKYNCTVIPWEYVYFHEYPND